MTRHYWGEFAGNRDVVWNTGGSVSTTTYSELESFLVDGKVTDRALQDAIRMSGWTADQAVLLLIPFWCKTFFNKSFVVAHAD